VIAEAFPVIALPSSLLVVLFALRFNFAVGYGQNYFWCRRVRRHGFTDGCASSQRYSLRANSNYWVDFEDFAFSRKEIIDVRYDFGGFGVVGRVTASEHEQAKLDPLADSADGIIGHRNADHADALILLARALSGIEAEEAMIDFG